MRIGIDARFLTHPQPGGFKTYSVNLVQALAQVDKVNEYILYVDDSAPQPTAPLGQGNFSVRSVSGRLPAIGMPAREQALLPAAMLRDRIDLFHAPSLTGPLLATCPVVVTIHDMIWHFADRFGDKKKQTWRRKMMSFYYRHLPRWTAQGARAIITVSQTSRTDIVEQLHIAPEQVFVTYEAADPSFAIACPPSELQQTLAHYGLSQSYILAIGSADPRKNIAGLLHAYALLPAAVRAQYELVIVWTHQFLSTEIAELGNQLGIMDRIHFVHQVSNQTLACLYQAATLFVFPSLYEGFGLPLLEAMTCGTPVAAANNSSIPEIVGNAALLFDAQDPAAMAQTLTQALCNEKTAQELRTKGPLRAREFTWERCARETQRVYELAAG